MELKDEKGKKNTLVWVAAVIALLVGGGIIFFMLSDDVPAVAVALKPAKHTAVVTPKPERKKIIKPDPAYKEAPEFEDFQAISKMYIHAMTPFKSETKQWLQGLVSLRTQREKIQLYTDMSKAAAAEASMYEWRQKVDKLKSGSSNVSGVSGFGRDRTSGLGSFSEEPPVGQYSLLNVRLYLYLKANKFTQSTASFSVGDERFLSLHKGDVFASRFLVDALDDNTSCAIIKDLTVNRQQRIC